ncbi:chromosome partitioning protein ParA [Vibrio atypicus]|uniref:chromosome partitioning protein ParA n=1 Tax=Vibrio atypicus TaxID=558271 RepID=UPI003735313A
MPEENENNKIILSEEDRQALESASTTKEQLTYLYQNFEPVLNRDDTLKGVDVDENGIRDDIDDFINALIIPENERGYYQQSSRHLQTVFDHDYAGGTEINTEIALANAMAYGSVINCLIQLNLDWDDATGSRRMIDALILNTKLRSQHYAYYNKALDGSGIEGAEPTGDDCE